VSSVARKHRVAPSLVFRWRRAARLLSKKSVGKPAFAPVMLPAPSPSTVAASREVDRGTIEIELVGGRRLRVSGPVDAAMLKQVIAAVEGL
jgi:transposase-like protein